VRRDVIEDDMGRSRVKGLEHRFKNILRNLEKKGFFFIHKCRFDRSQSALSDQCYFFKF
jgi:hypothetical protein